MEQLGGYLASFIVVDRISTRAANVIPTSEDEALLNFTNDRVILKLAIETWKVAPNHH